MRYAMLNHHSDLIGSTKAFDGAILFLPQKITDTVRELIYNVQGREGGREETKEVPPPS